MVEKMTENETKNDASSLKVGWAVYIALTILVILVLVFLVARDNEEKLFYSLMAAAAAYVFRPTDEYLRKKVTRLMGSAGEKDDQ